jgi:predicted dehydrogenase
MASKIFNLRWLCDLDQSRAEQVLGNSTDVQVTTDYTQALADPTVQSVAVATPAASHGDIALAALRAGKHVLVEKPMAATYEAGRRLVEEAERHDLTLMCDHTYCYSPAASSLKTMLHDGYLGELQYVDAVRGGGIIQNDVDVLWDLAPHDLSIINHILPKEVRPVGISAMGTDPIGAGKSCIAYVNLYLSNGSIAHVNLNWLSPIKVRRVVVGGSKRTAIWDDVETTRKIRVFDRRTRANLGGRHSYTQAAHMTESNVLSDAIAPTVKEHETLQSVIAEFARSIRTSTPAITGGRTGLAVLQLLDAASQSLKRGGTRVEMEVQQ